MINNPLLTEAARHDYQLAVLEWGPARAAPADGTIPQEVLERATKNHWHLPRAWREYLGISMQEAAARMLLPDSTYRAMENGFPRLSKANRLLIASGLSLRSQQLLAGSPSPQPEPLA